MQRFYFNLFNDVTAFDREGEDMQSADVALQSATRMAREMAAQSVREGRLVLGHRIEVADGSGDLVGTVYFGDVVQVLP